MSRLEASDGSVEEKRLQRAFKLVESRCVKLHVFQPSGRRLWTVVGGEGDQLVDDDPPYCSCRNFYYRVLSNRDRVCYHLLALKHAKAEAKYDLIELRDDEYKLFLELLLHDIARG